MIKRFLEDESGVTVIEYALIGGFILCAIVGSLTLLGAQLPIPFQRLSDGITAAIGN